MLLDKHFKNIFFLMFIWLSSLHWELEIQYKQVDPPWEQVLLCSKHCSENSPHIESPL